MLENLKNQVIEQLNQKPECRNSDIALTIAIWQEYYPQRVKDGMVRLTDLYDLPREDNIKRIRAKLQEGALERIENGKTKGDEYYYLPTNAKVAAQRQINAAVWEKILAYFRTPMPKQTEQLPRPVGLIGFSQIGENLFVVDGAEGKRYHVANSCKERGWECECDDFRFRGGNRDCKHIKAVVGYLEGVEKEKAAKSQTNLF